MLAPKYEAKIVKVTFTPAEIEKAEKQLDDLVKQGWYIVGTITGTCNGNSMIVWTLQRVPQMPSGPWMATAGGGSYQLP